MYRCGEGDGCTGVVREMECIYVWCVQMCGVYRCVVCTDVW